MQKKPKGEAKPVTRTETKLKGRPRVNQEIIVREGNTETKLAVVSGMRGKINIAQATKMRMAGETYEAIGKTFGVSQEAVIQALKRVYGVNIGTIKTYQDCRADILDAKQIQILDTISGKDLKDEKISSLSAAFKVFHDAARLERGQSTSNSQLLVVDLSKYETQDVVLDTDN